MLKSIVFPILAVNKDYFVPHSLLEFQSNTKVTDEEVPFFLIVVFILDQNEKMSSYRLFMIERAHILKIQ